MITLERIREDCDRELRAAMESGDALRLERLLKCKARFSDGNGFTRKNLWQDLMLVAWCFDYPIDELNEFEEYLEDSFKVKGLLYVFGADGREYPEEVLLEPENEGYYQFFKHGPVCKTVSMDNGFYQTYKLCDGEWVYDGSLQKWFEDPGYEYRQLRCEIPGRKEKCYDM